MCSFLGALLLSVVLVLISVESVLCRDVRIFSDNIAFPWEIIPVLAYF
jgi:hypothetical protein